MYTEAHLECTGRHWSLCESFTRVKDEDAVSPTSDIESPSWSCYAFVLSISEWRRNPRI